MVLGLGLACSSAAGFSRIGFGAGGQGIAVNAGLRSLRSLWAIASPWLGPIPEKDRRAFHIDLVSAIAYGLFMGFQMPFLPVLPQSLWQP